MIIFIFLGMDSHSKAKKLAGSASKAGSKGTARKAARKKKKRAPSTQNAGQSSGAESFDSRESGRDNLKESPITKEPKEKDRSKKCCCCGSRSSGQSPCDWFLSLFGIKKQSKVDDFIVFDGNSSMEQSLLWTKNGNQPTADDYLEFVSEHERGLVDHASNLTVPKPPEDKCDY